jgi:hypothetical protein
MSRPQFKPSREQRKMVEAMTGFGIPQEAIAKVVGISEPTLRKHFEREISDGVTIANSKVAEFLWKYATGAHGKGSEAVTAAIFWMKSRAGWLDRVSVEHTGRNGKDLIPPPPDPSKVALALLSILRGAEAPQDEPTPDSRLPEKT